MSNDPLKSFKIGERHPPKVSSAQRGSTPTKAAGGGSQVVAHATQSADSPTPQGVRFERLEEVLDHEDPRDLGGRLASMLTDLETFAQSHNSARDRAAAKHARQAIERTIDLLDHLFKVREALAAESLQQAGGPEASGTEGRGRGARPAATPPSSGGAR